MVGECLSDVVSTTLEGSGIDEQTSPVMTMSRMPVQTVSMNSSGISGYSPYSDSVSASPSMSIASSQGIPGSSSCC